MALTDAAVKAARLPSGKNSRNVTMKVEHRLGIYQADVISLDKKPSMASVKSEIEPIVNT